MDRLTSAIVILVLPILAAAAGSTPADERPFTRLGKDIRISGLRRQLMDQQQPSGGPIRSGAIALFFFPDIFISHMLTDDTLVSYRSARPEATEPESWMRRAPLWNGAGVAAFRITTRSM